MEKSFTMFIRKTGVNSNREEFQQAFLCDCLLCHLRRLFPVAAVAAHLALEMVSLG